MWSPSNLRRQQASRWSDDSQIQIDRQPMTHRCDELSSSFNFEITSSKEFSGPLSAASAGQLSIRTIWLECILSVYSVHCTALFQKKVLDSRDEALSCAKRLTVPLFRDFIGILFRVPSKFLFQSLPSVLTRNLEISGSDFVNKPSDKQS